MDINLPEGFEYLFEPHRYKVAYGGRGSAKSHSYASALVLLGAQRPLRILCAREIQQSIRDSVKRLLDDKIKEHQLSAFYRSTQTEVTGANGTSFTFAGLRANPDSIKSTEGLDIVWLEEANTVSQRSLDLLIPTMRKDGSEIWASFNPRDVRDPVYDMFLGKAGPPPRSVVRKFTFRDNEWFPQTLVDEMEWDRRRNNDKYLHVWEGEPWQRSDAQVLTNWQIEALDVPDFARPVFGADWGFSVDPTVLVKGWRWANILYLEHEAYRVRCRIEDTPYLFAGNEAPGRNRLRCEGVPGAMKHRITADSARPEIIDYMRRQGFDIHGARKGPGSLEEGVNFLQDLDIMVHPRCVHVEQELRHYSYKTDKLTDVVLPVLADKHNHVIDAIRYGLESERRAKNDSLGVGPEIIEG